MHFTQMRNLNNNASVARDEVRLLLFRSAIVGRARHRRNQMLPMMAFGITALGMVLVPMGFQFLAVLGGKALLLAKMALLLASINGIKRVNDLHYAKALTASDEIKIQF